MAFLIGYLFLFTSLYLLLQHSSFQTFVCQKLSDYIAGEIGTKIDVGRVDIAFFNSVRLENILIEDQNQDTLAYVDKLSLGIRFIKPDLTKMSFGKLELTGAYFNLYRDSTGRYNTHFLYGEEQDSSSFDFSYIKLSSLQVNSSRFRFHDYTIADTSLGVNYDHVDLSQLKLKASEVYIQDSLTQAMIQGLGFYEDNGFQLQKLASHFSISSHKMDFKSLKIETEGTDVNADYTMHYTDFSDFSDFVNQVRLESHFSDALVSMSDLSFFVPVFEGIKNQVYLQGDFGGTVSNLSGEEVKLFVDQETFLEGKFDLRGLPEIENTYMQFQLSELKTSAKGLRMLPYPPFKNQNKLTVPDNIDHLGDIIFKGEFTGFYNDFVAFGQFQSDLGKIRTDLSLKEDESGQYAYKGEISSARFQLGRLIEFENLSELGLDIQISGKGLDVEEIDAQAKGAIDYFTLNGYTYKSVQLNGAFTNQKFTGEVSLKDENLAFDFIGIVDASNKETLSRFQFNLFHSRLAKLNLFQKQDSLTLMSLCAEFDLLGNDIDDIKGMARVTDLRFSDSRLSYEIDSIEFKSTGPKANRNLRLRSDLIDGEINGMFFLQELPSTLMTFYEYYLPTNSDDGIFDYKQDFEFKFKIKDAEPLTRVLLPELSIESGTLIDGKIDTENHESQFHLKSGEIGYGTLNSIQPELNLNSKRKNAKFSFQANEFSAGALPIENFAIQSVLENGKSETKLEWKGLGSRRDSGEFNLLTQFYSATNLESRFQDSWFSIQDSIWTFDDSNRIWIDSSSIRFDQFRVYNDQQSFSLQGGLSKLDTDTLKMKLESVDLSYLSSVIPEGTASLSGFANGSASLQKTNQSLSLLSDIGFTSLNINGIDIGEAKLLSTWNPEKKALIVQANLGEGTEEIFALSGAIYPLREENSLDLLLSLDDFPAPLFKPYLEGILSEIEGDLEGRIKIEGTANEPLFDGDIRLIQTAFRIDYLNTKYSLSDKIFIRPDYLGFNFIELKDESGNIAVATGTVFHDNYQDINLDIGLQLKNFLVLNTNSKQNELYYGKAIVSGDANISGYNGQTNFEINVSTEKGTDLSIPISDGVGVSDNELITFTNSPKKIEVEEKVDLTGIQLSFALDIKPEARVKIIFDEQVGDIMKARGTGKLNLEINTLGDFNIYGQYIVDEGDYLFTLQNVLSKQFDIAPGSKIAWDGDPYSAVIDIKAIYELRASLVDIMPEDTTSNLRRRVPVELELQMSNQLFSPDIGFDIRLPKSDEEIKRRLQSILYVNQNDVNQQEMNQQVFGLLVLNRFLPPTSGLGSDTKYNRGTPGVNNGYEFLSNQLSSMLSKMSDQFDIGVNYRPGDEVTEEELDVSLSTEVFNNRLVLDGNVGYVSQTEANSEENQNNSSFIGEFSAEYKLSLDGRFRVRGFNRSTTNSLTQNLSPYTQGIGFFYREEFNTFNELWRRYFHADAQKNGTNN